MNNISKAFRDKHQLRKMANGGAVDPNILGSGLAQRAGLALQNRQAQLDAAIDGAASGEPAPAPIQSTSPASAPAVDDPPEQKSALRRFFGLVNGGEVKGKGGPTDDAVGPVALSDGEFVLPADTVDIVGRDKLEALRQATHKFVDTDDEPPKGLADGGAVEIRNPRMQRALRDAAAARESALAQKPTSGLRGGVQRLAQNITGTTPEAAATRASNAALRAGGFEAFDSGKLRGGLQRLSRAAQVIPGEDVLAGRTGLAAKLSGGGGVLGGLARGSAAIAPAAGALQSLADDKSGFSDEFDKSIGVPDTALGRGISAGVQLLNNAGNAALPFGLAGRLGRGLAGIGNEGFVEGFKSDDPRTEFENRQKLAAANASRDRVAERVAARAGGGVGVDARQPPTTSNPARRTVLRDLLADPTAGGKATDFGNFGGDARIFGTASTPGGPIDTFSGRGTPESPRALLDREIQNAVRNLSQGGDTPRRRGPSFGPGSSGGGARAINERFDSILRDGFGRNVKFGSDFATRQALNIERARNAALGNDAQDQTTRRGQDLNAANSAASSERDSRTKQLEALRGLSESQNLAEKSAGELELRARAAQAAAVRQARGDQETGIGKITNEIDRSFNTGDDVADTQKRERFSSFLFGSDPEVLQTVAGVDSFEKLADLAPQARSKAIQDFRTLFDFNEARNAAANKGVFNSGVTTNRVTTPADVRESRLSDVFNGQSSLSPIDLVRTNLPFIGNKNVVIDRETGQATPFIDAVAGPDGTVNAERAALIARFTGKDANGDPIAPRQRLRGN